MSSWTLLLLQILPILLLIYYFLNQKYKYWSSRGVSGPKPLPIVGTLLEQIYRGTSITELEWDKKYGKIYGTYTGLKPALVVTDPELIKQVAIKDFHAFVNRPSGINVDSIAKQNLFFSQGENWKRIRAITSPTFTSGKLRGMNPLMMHCVDKLAGYFEHISKKGGDGVISLKEVIAGFTIDVIASTSFATETNSNTIERSEPNAVLYHGLALTRPNPVRIITMILPEFVRVLIQKAFPLVHFNFFINLVQQVIKQRRESGQKRNDFVQLLMDAYVGENELGEDYDKLTASADKEEYHDGHENQEHPNGDLKGNRKTLTDEEIIAQCLIFFLAGFETTGSAITHCLFELAKNPILQDRLLQELNTALEGMDPQSEQYYETVTSKIPYLDAVLKETLRRYPPLTSMQRICEVDGYKLGGVSLEKETTVSLGAYVVHHNPEYYPEPERFNPDRWMPENKDQLTPYTYMPFGQGPRNCIGMRFAYQEAKLCLAKIIRNYQFQPTPETPEKMQFSKFLLFTAKPFPIKVSKRV